MKKKKSVQNKIYVSGPITGKPKFNKPQFKKASSYLRGNGFFVYNPFELEKRQNETLPFYLRKELPAICECSSICLLPGWGNSVGCEIETRVAQSLSLKVYTFQPKTKELLYWGELNRDCSFSYGWVLDDRKYIPNNHLINI